jgi:hypothetical protein
MPCQRRLSVAILFACALGGCASAPTHQQIESAVEADLDKLCALPTKTDADKVLRSRLVLAVIAGYAFRSIQTFSNKTDENYDAGQAIAHFDSTFSAIEAAKSYQDKGIFPVYRADYIDELIRAAAIASQPTLRAGKV